MATRAELAALRAQVRKLEHRATRKAQRLARETGAKVAGTDADPRRPGKARHYTAAQLKAYADQLQQFTSRRTQYVGGAAGAPLPTQDWKSYKEAERAARRRVQEFYNQYKDMVLPDGMTIDQRQQLLKPVSRHVTNPIVNSTLSDPITRTSNQVANADALRRLTQDMRRRDSQKWLDKQFRAARKSYEGMIEHSWLGNVKDEVAKLTDRQFNVLWHYTKFARSLATDYAVAQNRVMNRAEAAQQADAEYDMMRQINWVKNNIR